MGVVNVYTGLSEEYKTIKGNGTVRDMAHEVVPEIDLSHAIILNAGEQITPDYQVKENDIIFIRLIPGAVATVIAVISCVTAAVALGAAIYSAVEQQKAQEQMEKAQKQAKALAERITQLPFLKGASNRSALGYNIPYVMGSIYNVPYKLVSGFYTISGENGKNQYWNANFICGYNNALIQDVSVGTVKIKNHNSSISVPEESENIEVLLDSANTPYNFDDCTYYDPEDKIEIKYEDEMSLAGIGEKVTAIGFNDELDTNQPVTKQLEEHTYKVDICVKFDGLRRYSDSWLSKSVTIKCEWSTDGNAWNDAGTLVTGEVNSRKTVRFVKTITFAPSECVGKDIKLRLTRTTPLEESNSVETAQLCFMNCWQYDNKTSTTSKINICRPLENPWRERTTRIGLRVISNDSTKDQLDQINCNVYGKARIWNGTSWTTTKYPTRNNAAWVLEVMTTNIHPHSQFSDDEIDLKSLGRLYEHCKKNKFYCDGLLTEDTKKRDVLNNILAECNATMYLDHTTGKWTFAIEQKQTTPVALLNDQCIKNITVSKSFDRKPYAMKTTFTNRDSWAVDTFYQTAEGLIDSADAYGTRKIITETAPNYITTFAHAFKFTERQIAKQKLQPREITAVVGREGDYYPLYSKILLQSKELKIGRSDGVIHGVVMEGDLLSQIITSDLCDLTDNKQRYGVIIQAQNDTGMKLISVEVTGEGKTKKLRLKTPTACTIIPEYGNSYSFGQLDKNGNFRPVTNEMMIYGTKQTADGWELTLKDYNDAIFDGGIIPDYKSNLTTPKESNSTLPDVTLEKLSDLVEANMIPGKDAFTVYQECNSYIFNADENGEIAQTEIKNTIHVMLENREMPFHIGTVEVPDGFYISTDNDSVLIRGEAGREMQKEGVIKIPVYYHPIEEEIEIGFGDTVITNGKTPIGHYKFSKKETRYTLLFAYAKAMRGQQGETSYNAHFDVSSFCFAVDEEGKAWGERVPTVIKLLEGEKEVPFKIIEIQNNKEEVTAKIDNDRIIFESVAGAKIKESASIPVKIKYQHSDFIGIGYGAATFGADGIGIGYRKYSGPVKEFELFFNYSTVKAGVNRGLKSTIDDFLQPSGKRYKGDFFTWGGETTTIVYEGVNYTFLKGHVYTWNGQQWSQSQSDSQLSQSFNNVMAVLDDEIIKNDSKLEMTMKKLSSVTVFCEELASQVAFLKKVFAQNITMQPGGLFKSESWNGSFDSGTGKITTPGSKGWAMDYYGKMNMVDAVISGQITANTLFLTVNAGNVKLGTVRYQRHYGSGTNEEVITDFASCCSGTIKLSAKAFTNQDCVIHCTIWKCHPGKEMQKLYESDVSGWNRPQSFWDKFNKICYEDTIRIEPADYFLLSALKPSGPEGIFGIDMDILTDRENPGLHAMCRFHDETTNP